MTMSPGMKFASIIIVFMAIYILSATCNAQSKAPESQSVSGDFAKQWLKTFEGENPQKIKQEERTGNGSDLWNWGNIPKGYLLVNGKLERDPSYLLPLLNLTSNWLGESYTDPETGLPLNSYVDPVTGTKYYVYLNPKTGETYCTLVVPKVGKSYYVYIDPSTGNQVKSEVSPFGTTGTLNQVY
jgi:hypothetical protein